MDGRDLKEVYFDEYCPKCKHEKLKENQDPCHDCLQNPGNTDSHKPVHYKEKV